MQSQKNASCELKSKTNLTPVLPLKHLERIIISPINSQTERKIKREKKKRKNVSPQSNTYPESFSLSLSLTHTHTHTKKAKQKNLI